MLNEPDIQPVHAIVRYEVKLTLGQYESETLSCELSNSAESPVPAEELMRKARRICWVSTTKAVQAEKNKLKGE